MRDHSAIEELMAADALGGLDPKDREALARERASHGADCSECLRLESDYAEVAGRMAFALEPVAARAGFEDETVDLATERSLERPRLARSGRPAWRGLVAVAAALVLFAAGWLTRGLGKAGAPAFLPAEAKIAAFQAVTPDVSGHLAVAYRPGKVGVYVFGSDLGPLPSGKAYELWTIQGKTPVAGGCFTPDANGDLLTYVDAPLGGAELMAVTVEPASCSEQPTTTPILTAQIQTA